jgi:hypothetical protein
MAMELCGVKPRTARLLVRVGSEAYFAATATAVFVFAFVLCHLVLASIKN